MRKIHWVAKSNDKKIGKVIASYSSKETCPDSCDLKTGGCYAWGLFYISSLGRKIEAGILKNDLKTALSKRDKSCKIVRHRVAGDIVGDESNTLKDCYDIKAAGLINIGYTHNWRDEASGGLKEFFRASCNTLQDVIEARAAGWSTTLVVSGNVPSKTTLADQKAILCPADSKKVTCNTCTLCKVSKQTADTIVMFKLHGNNATLKGGQGKTHHFK